MGMRTIKLASGAEYEVPEENFEAAMRALDEKGIKFSADVRPDTGPPPEPEPAQPPGRSVPFVEPNPNMQGEYPREKPGVLEQLVNGGKDAISGLTHGLTLHNDANLWDTVGLGDEVRARNAEAQNRSPNIYGIADTIGGAVPSVLMGGAGLARGALANIAGQGAAGAVQGYARGVGDSDPNASLQSRSSEGLQRAEKEGVLSALVAGGASALGGAANWGRDLWANAADKARAAAVFGGGDMAKVAESKGLDYLTDNAGRLPEDLGVTNRFIPQDAATYAKRLGARADLAKNQVDAAAAEAGAQGVKGPGFIDKPGMLGDMGAAASAARRGVAGDREAAAAALDSVRGGMAQQPLKNPTDLLAMKRALDSKAYPGALQGSAESLMGQAHKQGADIARGNLRNAMGYASDDVNQAFTQGNQDLGNALTLQEGARNLAARQYGGGGVMGNLGAAAVGAAAGMPFGQGATGAALGLARPAYSAAQRYGADFGANVSRGLEGASGYVGGLGNATAATPAGPVGAGLSPSDRQQQLSGEARGYLGSQAVSMVLQRNPEALGKYGPELSKAQQDGTLNGTLYKLYNRDADFRMNVYPQIQQLTRE
jgi:hypothetical protein